MQFPIEQLPQRSPVDTALNSYLKMQQAMAAPEQMKMQRAIQQAALQKSQMENQYYPQDIQSQLALRNAQMAAMQNKGPSYQSQIGQQVADRMNLVKQYGADSPQVQMFDKNMGIVNAKAQATTQYQNALNNSLSIRYATPQARAQMMSFAQNTLHLPTEKAIQVAANPAKYFPMGADGELDFNQFQPNGVQSQAAPQGVSQLPPAQPAQVGTFPVSPEYAQYNPTRGTPPGAAPGMIVNPQAAQQAAQANPQLAQQLGVSQAQGQPSQQPMQNGSPISAALQQTQGQLTPEEKERAAQQGIETQSFMDTKTIPVQQQNAIYAAIRARVFADSLVKEIPNVTQYFNPTGKARLTKDQFASLMSGKTPPGLENLAYFQSDLENYKLEAANMLKVPADQQARGDFAKAFDLNSWYTNPELAQKALMHIIEQVTKAEKLNIQPLEQARQQSNQTLPSIGQTLAAQNGGKNSAAPAKSAGAFPSKTDASGRVMYQAPNGKWYYGDQL